MAKAIGSSEMSSIIKYGTEQFRKEQNRRAIMRVFEEATYNRQGFAQATHEIVNRGIDKSGRGFIVFLEKEKTLTLLEKALNLLKRSVTKFGA